MPPLKGAPLGQLKLSSQHCQAGDSSASQFPVKFICHGSQSHGFGTDLGMSFSEAFHLSRISGANDTTEGSCLPWPCWQSLQACTQHPRTAPVEQRRCIPSPFLCTCAQRNNAQAKTLLIAQGIIFTSPE